MKSLSRALAATLVWMCPGVSQVPYGIPPRLWESALESIHLEPDDFSFRSDYVPIDAARLPIVDRLMAAPLTLPGWLAVTAANARLDRFDLGAVDRSGAADSGRPLPWRWAEARVQPSTLTPARPQDPVAAEFPRALAPILAALEALNRSAAPGARIPLARGDLTDSLLAFLQHDVPELLWNDPAEEFRSPEWQDSVQQAEEDIARRLVRALPHIPRQAIWSRGLFLAGHFSICMEGLGPDGQERLAASPGASARAWDTPFGRVARGTGGPDRYTGRYTFIFDPGGDDIYELEHDPRFPSRVLIDLGGRDTYTARTDAALAGGLWGTQILYDRQGDDTYRAQRIDLGAGLFGWGILIDRQGHDVYEGDTFLQGAGAFGYGVLIDSSGNDTYNASLFAQGFGYTGGVGIICDQEGNDHYYAGGLYKATLHYTDRYLSEAQGCAYSYRPFLSGGIGLLLDRRGNDDYNCDIAGQGSSYWWGIGGLWDGGGNDRYLAYQYAQGSAAHMTAGVLVDESGDDVYMSKGVSQGCGHDLGPGLLWDLQGDDIYIAFDLSQGAGSANGLGILFDARGDDRYYVKSDLNTQGYGNPRRDYGSIGLLLDAAGSDRYDGPGSDGTWWQVDSKWGVGIDFDSTWSDR